MSRHRDVMGDPFSRSDYVAEEASDPMSGLSNLADCMLVLACGLMVALVVHWNLDVTPHYEVVEETGNLVDVEGDPQLAVRGSNESSGDQQSTFENMGTLYRDPSTGTMYYLREWPEGEGKAASGANDGSEGGGEAGSE